MLRIIAAVAALIALLLLYTTNSILAWLTLTAMFAHVMSKRRRRSLLNTTFVAE